MNFNLRREWPLLAIAIIPLAIAILVYPRMPEQIPIHWNVKGQVDNYGSKTFGTIFLPILNIIMYVFLLILPKLDPKKANYSKFSSSYTVIRYALHCFFFLMFGVVAAASMGYPVNVGKWIPIGVSILFIVMGNIMGRVRHNYFVGFKFPWTLANEEVWKKTHQFGAKWMVAGGFAALIGAIFTSGAVTFTILMAAIFLPMIVTTVYSYLVYKQITKN